MNIHYIPLEEAPDPYDPDTDDNLVIAKGPNGLQVVVSDEHCCLYVVKAGSLHRTYMATAFSESDPPAMVQEVEAYLEDAAEEDS